MRNRKTQGFTLIELLIVIAIIGILAAVLIPNLLNARERAFDTGAQTCLKELSMRAEVVASLPPFTYAEALTPAAATAADFNACDQVTIGGDAPTDTTFHYTGQRLPSTRVWEIRQGTGVTVVAPVVP